MNESRYCSRPRRLKTDSSSVIQAQRWRVEDSGVFVLDLEIDEEQESSSLDRKISMYSHRRRRVGTGRLNIMHEKEQCSVRCGHRIVL
jgi:hypothetical protein